MSEFSPEPSADWYAKNKEHVMCNYDGTETTRYTRDFVRIKERFVSISKYREDASKVLRRTLDYIESKYGKYFFAYHPAAMATGEWAYQGWTSKIPNGYDKFTLQAWKNWLVKKYTATMQLCKKNGTDPMLHLKP